MATVKTAYGSSPTSLAVTALVSLANAAFWKSAAIDFTTNAPVWVELQVKISTANTGAGLLTGYSNVYLSCSNDNSVYDGNITPGDATWTPSPTTNNKSLRFLGRIPMESTATTTLVYVSTFNIELPPKYAVVVIENQSNKAFLSSACTVTYLENILTVA